MIVVEQDFFGALELSFKYYPEYISKAKSLNGKFNQENKTWIIDPNKFNELEEVFKGELFFKTPRWEITGEKAPDYSNLYKFNTKCEIESLGFKLKPFNYQEFGIKFLVDRLTKNNMAFIADAVGLGKTAEAIGAMKFFLNKNVVKNIVIVCKKSLKQQWKDEIEKFIDFNGDIYIADDNKKKRNKTYEEIKNNTNNTVLIINYHLLLNDADLINATSPDMVIYDEVHCAKKIGGEINKGCAKITKNAKYCLFMTGTPIMSKPDDMYGIISIKDKKYFGKYKDFEKRYVTKYYNGKFENVVGYKNLDELRNKMQEIILRRTEEEVTIDLPEVVVIDKLCDLDGKQKGCLEVAEQKSLETEEKLDKEKEKLKKFPGDPKILASIEKLEGALKGYIATEQAIANSPVLFHYSKSKGVREVYKDLTPSESYLSNKMQILLDLCEEIRDGEKKVVIFSKYETVSTYVCKLLNRNKIGAVTYSGKLNDEERVVAINEFKNNTDITAIVGTDAMSEGLNLQIANTVINVDLPFNQAILEQRKGRVRRAGSNYKTAFVYNLITKDSIDITIYNKIKETQNSFDSFVSANKAQSALLKRLSN